MKSILKVFPLFQAQRRREGSWPEYKLFERPLTCLERILLSSVIVLIITTIILSVSLSQSNGNTGTHDTEQLNVNGKWYCFFI